MQSLGRDVLSQLARTRTRTLAVADSRASPSKSRRETGGPPCRGSAKTRGDEEGGGGSDRDGDGGGYGDGHDDGDEDVLPRTALSVPSPARPCSWLDAAPSASASASAADRPRTPPRPRGPATADPGRGRGRDLPGPPSAPTAAPALAPASEVRLAQHREDISRHQRQMGALTYRSPAAYHDTAFQSLNAYARPGLHSAKVRLGFDPR